MSEQPRGNGQQQPADPTEQRIVAEIEVTRTEMSGTIDEIGQRLSPQAIVDQARTQIREATVGKVERVVQDAGDAAQETGNTIVDTIRENPVPAALAALGIGWLVVRARDQQAQGGRSWDAERQRSYRRDWYERDAVARQGLYGRGTSASDYRSQATDSGRDGGVTEQIGERAGEVGQQARRAADDIAGQARQAADDISGQAQQTWQDVQYQAQEQAANAQRQIDRTLQENPLALGALAVGVGAAVALAIPETQREREILGEHRDRLVSQVERVAGDALGEAEQTATKALSETEDKAREAGQQMRQEAREGQTSLAQGQDQSTSASQARSQGQGRP